MTAPAAARLTWPNAISFARLCAVPVAIWLVLRQDWGIAFALFVAAGLSDALDGWLARRGAASRLGAVLDPLADKALIVGMTVMLAAVGQLPAWMALLVVFRDLVIVGGVVTLWLTGHETAIRPIAISKLNTVLQIALVGLVLGLQAAAIGAPMLRAAIVGLVAATTLLSGAAYLRRVVAGP